MSDCDFRPPANTGQERRILRIALALNASMALIGGVCGWVAHSTGLLADALDMLSDAMACAIGLIAIGRTTGFKANAALLSGSILLLLGLGVLVEVVQRVMQGTVPHSGLMIGTALLSLAVNLTILRLLAPLKTGEVHLRATWLFTRADVVANIGVVVAGLLVNAMDSSLPDYIIGFLISLYVMKEAVEILASARKTRGELEPKNS